MKHYYKSFPGDSPFQNQYSVLHNHLWHVQSDFLNLLYFKNVNANNSEFKFSANYMW